MLEFLTTDLSFVIWLVLLSSSCLTFPVAGAPKILPNKFLKLLWYDISSMSRCSINPFCALAQSIFVVFGLFKICYGVLWFKESKWIFGLMVFGGISSILMSILNGDVNMNAHLTFTYLTILPFFAVQFLYLKASN